MSLDVYLISKGTQNKSGGIFIREDGGNKEISRQEWDERFPGREPVVVEESPTNYVYEANITHNLSGMADRAGIYEALWRPEEIKAVYAKDLIERLEFGLKVLNALPDEFRKHNPSNGWGSYEGLVRFISNYLDACREYPDAEISVSR